MAKSTDDLLSFNGIEQTQTLTELRAEQQCKCMSCWGETDQTTCTATPNYTAHNLALLASYN